VFIACGINHQTAPIELRERIAVTPNQHSTLLKQFMSIQDVHEMAILSTCNRTEFYGNVTPSHTLLEFFSEHTRVPITQLQPHWYSYEEQAAIHHALRVASGLDSMMIGEPQIFGQLKQAFAQACDSGTVGASLKTIFPFVFRASKRIRHTSGIHKNPVSLASVAAQQILRAFPNPEQLNILMIGTGDMAQLVMKYLKQAQIKNFWVASRTLEHATLLAQQHDAQVVDILKLSTHLPSMDVIITATACPIPFITKEMIEQALPARHHHPMFFLDLALPRNIQSDISQFEPVTLCNLDDLKTQCELNHQERQVAAALAETLVQDELEQYLRWSKTEATQQLITQFRTHMQILAQQELQLALSKLNNGACEQELMHSLTHRLLKKLTHLPTISLRQAALEGRSDLLEFMNTLMNPISISSEEHEAIH
jgi:glutamyl-tRNA reductase